MPALFLFKVVLKWYFENDKSRIYAVYSVIRKKFKSCHSEFLENPVNLRFFSEIKGLRDFLFALFGGLTALLAVSSPSKVVSKWYFYSGSISLSIRADMLRLPSSVLALMAWR